MAENYTSAHAIDERSSRDAAWASRELLAPNVDAALGACLSATGDER
jgi:hypothetical protein